MTLEDIEFVLNTEFREKDQGILFDTNENEECILRSKIDTDGLVGCEYRLYRFDPNNKDIFPFFSTVKGRNVKNICDFFLFVAYHEEIYVLLIEHKSGSGSSNVQLEASECFINYIRSTIKRVGRDDKCNIIKVRLHILYQKKQNKMSKPQYENGVLCYFWDKFRIKAIIES